MAATGVPQEKGKRDGSIFVAVRIRPILDFELDEETNQQSQSQNGGATEIEAKASSIHVKDPDEHTFAFDAVYQHPSNHSSLYKSCAANVVDGCLGGFNGTVFCYGQTGSGKTFTMHGAPEDPGIIPRAFDHIFKRATAIEEECSDTFAIKISFLEIYNEKCRDLLSDTSSERLKVREDQKGNRGFFVENLTYVVVHSPEAALRWLNEGGSKRATAATSMNDESSRSHAIFTLVIERTTTDDRTICGKLSLVDLAGSERQSRTNAQGQTLREAKHINQSLSQLGNVINALTTGTKSHIPYRNSILTKLLADSLGGNARTALIANMSPARVNFEESLSTMRFASRVKLVKNDPVVNEDPKDMKLRLLESKVRSLSHANRQAASRIEELTAELACYSGSDDLMKEHKSEISRIRKSHAIEISKLRKELETCKKHNDAQQQKKSALLHSGGVLEDPMTQPAISEKVPTEEGRGGLMVQSVEELEIQHRTAMEQMARIHESALREKDIEMDNQKDQAAKEVAAAREERTSEYAGRAYHAATMASKTSELTAEHEEALRKARKDAEELQAVVEGEQDRARSLGHALAEAEALHSDAIAKHRKDIEDATAQAVRLEETYSAQNEALVEQLADARAHHAATMASKTSELTAEQEEALRKARKDAEELQAVVEGEQDRARSLGHALAEAEALHSDAIAKHRKDIEDATAQAVRLEETYSAQNEALAEQLAAADMAQKQAETSHAATVANIELNARNAAELAAQQAQNDQKSEVDAITCTHLRTVAQLEEDQQKSENLISTLEDRLKNLEMNHAIEDRQSKLNAVVEHENTLKALSAEHSAAIMKLENEYTSKLNEQEIAAAALTTDTNILTDRLARTEARHADTLAAHDSYVAELRRNLQSSEDMSIVEREQLQSEIAGKQRQMEANIEAKHSKIMSLEEGRKCSNVEIEKLIAQLATAEAARIDSESSHASDLASLECTHAAAISELESAAIDTKSNVEALVQSSLIEQNKALETMTNERSAAVEALESSREEFEKNLTELKSRLSLEEQKGTNLAQELTELQKVHHVFIQKSSEDSLFYEREQQESLSRLTKEQQHSESLQQQLSSVESLFSDTIASEKTQSVLHEAEMLRESSQAAERESTLETRLEAAVESLNHNKSKSSEQILKLQQRLADVELSLRTSESAHESESFKQSQEIKSLIDEVKAVTAAHAHAVEKWMAGVKPAEYVISLEEGKRRFKQTIDETNRMHAEVCDHLRAVIEKREQEIEEEKRLLFFTHSENLQRIKEENATEVAALRALLSKEGASFQKA